MFKNSIYILGPYTKKCSRNVCFYYCHCLLLPKSVITTAAGSLGSRQGKLPPASALYSHQTRPAGLGWGQSCDLSKGSEALEVSVGREGRGNRKSECCLSFFLSLGCDSLRFTASLRSLISLIFFFFLPLQCCCFCPG